MARESLGPAVADGEVRYSSVSALQRFLACPRAWWLRYVARLPDKPPSRNAILGTAGHARWQRYGETGDDRELAGSERVALSSGWAPALPLPRPGLQFETPIHSSGLASPLQIEGVPLVGYVDVVDRDAGLVVDWKYKGDLDQYVSTDADLVSPHADAGVQMIGYVVATAIAPEVEVRHVTMALRGAPDARITRARVSLQDARSAWQVVEGRVAARGGLRATARLSGWRDVPCDHSHCDRYGGCAYRARCHDLVAQLLSHPTKGAHVGIFDRLAATSPSTSTPAPAAPPPAAPTQKRLLHIEAPDAPPLPTAATAQVGARYMRGGRVVVCTGEAGGWQLFAVEGVTGADGKPVIDRVPLTDPCPPPAPAASVPATAPSAAPAPVSSEAQSPAAPAPSDTTAPAPKRRGRPAKAAAPALGTSPEPGTETKPVGESEGVYLYFGCAPLGVPTSTLHAYVQALDQRIREGLQDTALDVRLSQAEPLKFKAWQAVLYLAAQQTPPPPGHYVVTGYGDDRIDAVAQALIPLATLVVR